MRIKITLQYNGVPYFGSQSQTSTDKTVMGTLQQALSRLGVDQKPIAAGRTDKAVHASGQVVHCDLPEHWRDLDRLHVMLDRQLPKSIRIRNIVETSADFHARYSAKRRVYRYITSEKTVNPFESDFITFTPKLDLRLLNTSMKIFVGTHDFALFKKRGSATNDDIRTIYRAFAYTYRGKTVLYFEADGYLRSQIRLMVGALLAVNNGNLDIERLKEQLNRKAYHHRAPAPPNGLYLAKVKY